MISFVKDEGNNLAIVATTLHSVINCEPLKILRVYEGTCFGHVMFKACQYAINNNKISVRFQYVSVKDALVGLLQTLFGPKIKETWSKNALQQKVSMYAK
jgi:hypothetical protein